MAGLVAFWTATGWPPALAEQVWAGEISSGDFLGESANGAQEALALSDVSPDGTGTGQGTDGAPLRLSFPPGQELGVYIVQRGDNLFRLALRFGSSVALLAERNGIQDPNRIHVGQALFVPMPADAASRGYSSDVGGVSVLPAEEVTHPDESGDSRLPKPPPAPRSAGMPEQGGVGTLYLPDSLFAVLGAQSPQAAEVLLLAQLISSEARGQPFAGQVAVGSTVLNRVKSPLFPGTVRDVIYQGGQFRGLESPSFLRKPTRSSVFAAVVSLSGDDPTGGALFFYNPERTLTPEFWAGRPVTTVIGNHVFTR